MANCHSHFLKNTVILCGIGKNSLKQNETFARPLWKHIHGINIYLKSKSGVICEIESKYSKGSLLIKDGRESGGRIQMGLREPRLLVFLHCVQHFLTEQVRVGYLKRSISDRRVAVQRQ
jgi:hypothetical protein